MNTLAALAPLPPLSQPSVDGIFAAARAAKARPVAVHWRGTINEIAIWQEGEWIGSVFYHPNGGLGAWSSVGDHLAPAYSAEDAVRQALFGHHDYGKLRVSESRVAAARRLKASRGN